MAEAAVQTAAPTQPNVPAQPNTPAQPNVAAQPNVPAAPKPVEPPPALYEVKVNGKVMRMSLDELRSRAGLSTAAHERFQEAARIEREAKQFMDQVKKDPLFALKDPNLSPQQRRQLIEQYYHEQYIQPETMTEEQKRIKQLESELKTKAQKEEELLQQQQSKEQEALDIYARDQVQKDVIQALETSGLPKNRFTVARMAYWMKQNIKNGFDAPMDIILQQVKDERTQIVSSLLNDSKPEQIVEMFGEDLIKKLRRWDLERLQAKRGGKIVDDDKPARAKKAGSKSMSSVDDWFNDLRRSK